MMMLSISIVLLTIFLFFQLLYIFIPLFSTNSIVPVDKMQIEKGMTILIPAFNEEKTILNCLQGIVNVSYENLEAIFISDGSTDRTFELLCNYLNAKPSEKMPAGKINHEQVMGYYQSVTYPNIYLIDKINGGKADALNVGIEYASHDIIITLDADSILDPNSLHAMNTAFNDEKVLAAGGMVQISQGFNGSYIKPKPMFNISGLIRYQIIQYLTDFYLHKTTQAKLRSITVIAGAFGAFRRHALFEADGYRKTVGEDLDITLRMHTLIKKKYKRHKLIFVPNAICYTECPSTFKDLLSQRIRWQKGFIDCLIKFKKSFFVNLGVPVSIYMLVDSLILGTLNAFPTIFVPLVIIINQNYDITLFFLSITFLLAYYRSITTIIISRRYGHKYSPKDYMKLMLFLPIEILTYRLLGLVFVTVGTLLYAKNKDGWNSVERIGVNNQSYGDGILVHGKKTASMEGHYEKPFI